MAQDVETLIVNFTADIKRYEAQLRKQVRATEASAKKSQRAWARSNRSIQRGFSANGRAATAMFAVMTAGVIGGTKVMSDFGQSMATVKAVTMATEDQMAKLTAKARELGANTRFSASQAGEGMLFLARAGFEVDQVLEAIEPTLRLAQAGAVDLGRAADISSNILQAFQLPVSDLSRVVDVMAKTTNSANTDIQQMGDAMKLVAPLSAAFGVSIEETSAYVGALSDAGMQATLAGTGLRRVMAELQSPTTKTQKILAEFGLSAEDVKISSVGLEGAMQALADANFDVNRSMEVFQQRGGPAFINMFKAFNDGKVERLTNSLKDASGTADEMAGIMDDTLQGAMKEALSALQELVLVLGEIGAEQALIDFFKNLRGALRDIAQFAESTARSYDLLFSANKDLTQSTYDAADAMEVYDQALMDARGTTGTQGEYLKGLAEDYRKLAVAAQQAAQVERQAEIDRQKAEVRRLRGKLGENQRGGKQLRDRQKQEIREASEEVQKLEREMRETQAKIERMMAGTYATASKPLKDLGESIEENIGGSTQMAVEEAKDWMGDLINDLAERAQAVQKQTDFELSAIKDLKDARDELAGDQRAIMEREFQERRRIIERDIQNEARRNEAIALLQEERLLREKAFREEALGDGQYSEDPIERLRAEEAAKLAVLESWYSNNLERLQEYENRRAEIVAETEEKIMKARGMSAVQQISAYENLFGSMADLAKGFAGEQSGIYKALFAVEKAFAIASSVIAIQTGIANALSLPFPANLGAAATVAAQGASVISSIQAVSGFKDGGIDIRGPGTGRSDSIPAMISAGESVINANATRKNKALLTAINNGEDVSRLVSGTAGGGNAIDASVTIMGNVTEDVMPKLERMLQQQEQRIVRAVPGIARAERIESKRRKR